MRRKPLPKGMARVLRLTQETGLDLVKALSDDGRIDLVEAAEITIRLLASIVHRDPPDDAPRAIAWWSPEAAALQDLARAIRAGDRDRAHAALDRALGWSPPDPA